MATSDQVQQLYLVYFGRPADAEGLKYWTNDTETPLATIANGFATTTEFTKTTDGKSFTQIVNQFYVSLFGRNGEPEGVQFWVNLLSQGKTTIQQVGLNISDAALALPATNTDNISVTSKIKAGGNWTAETAKTTQGLLAYTGQAGVDAGVAFLAPVTTTATIPNEAATTAAVNNLIAANSGVGSNADLSVFTDVFTATSAVRLSATGNVVETLPFRFTSTSQSVGAVIGTVQATDALVDPSTSDSDNLNITITPGFGNLANLVTTNIENFKFFLNGADAAGVFAFGANQTNVKSVVLTGTIAAPQVVGGPAGYTINNFGASGATVLDATGVTTAGVNGAITSLAYAAPGLAANDQANVTMSGGAGNDVFTGGSGDDVLNGNAGNDQLNGGLFGADSINGGAGADNLAGGAGKDVLDGGADNDILDGGAGDDKLTGGTGVDAMTGGAGADTFSYGSFTQLVTDTGKTQATSDTITDFASVADKIQTGVAGSATNFVNLGAAATYDAAKALAESAAGFDGARVYVYTQIAAGPGVLFVDTDKNGTADASILFTGAPALVAADIIA